MKTHTTLKLTVAVLALALVGNVSAQAPATAPSAQKTESKEADLGSLNVSICYEAFSLPIAKAGELQRKGMSDEELYKEVVGVGKIERLLVLRTKSGDHAVVESVSNYRYPTEFSPPAVPQKKEAIQLPIALTAFEVKDLGDTLEIEPTLSENGKAVSFQFGVNHTALARREKWGKGLAEQEQPQFELQKLNTNVTAALGSPRFIGTLNPPFGNGAAARAEQNVWFCFITPTLVPNNTAPQKKAVR